MTKLNKATCTRFRYTDREVPDGYLPLFFTHPGAHALYFYATLAMSRYHDVQKGHGVVMEDDEWPTHSLTVFKNMLRAVELVYGIPTDKFIRYWDVVDAQLADEGLVMPKELKFNDGHSIIMPGGIQ